MPLRRARLLVVATVVASLLVPTAARATGARPSVRTAWTLHTLSGVPAQYPNFLTVDCPSVSFCAMTSDLAYASTLSGTSVHTVDVAALGSDPHQNYGVIDVACSAPGDCVASGEHDQGPCCGSSSYRVDLSGRQTWTANPAASSAAAWHDVDCNPLRCVDVGTADEGVDFGGIADRATGKAWVNRKLITPYDRNGDGIYTDVDAVARPPRSGACIAAGAGGNGPEDGHSLLFFRQGKVWRGVLQALPAGAPDDAGAHQLSCPTAGVCEGFGDWPDGSANQLFLETMTNLTPAAELLPLPDGLISGQIYGTQLECTAPTDCAGAIDSASGTVFAREYDGAWSFVAARVPAGAIAGSAYVSDVSCASTRRCVAVGQYRARSGGTPVYRPAIWTRSHGRWTVQDPGAPSGVHLGPADDERIEAVDCGGSTRCVVMGSAGDRVFYGVGSFTG